MNYIGSISEIQTLMANIRNLRKEFYTNFFPYDFRVELWISKHTLFYTDSSDTVLFYNVNDGFVNLFYCSVSLEALDNSLKSLDKNDIYVTELVANNVVSPVQDIFFKNGFIKRSSLIRMTRINESGAINYDKDNKIRNARISDLANIQDLISYNFDKFSEQLPDYEQIINYINQGDIFVRYDDDKIAGFLIYALTGSTIQLKFWLVCEEYRDKKIGSALIHEFFNRGKHTHRQTLWVIDSNENAIKRYEHYGFNKEDLFDTVLIKKNK